MKDTQLQGFTIPKVEIEWKSPGKVYDSKINKKNYLL
jgi:hypothetical protein